MPGGRSVSASLRAADKMPTAARSSPACASTSAVVTHTMTCHGGIGGLSPADWGVQVYQLTAAPQAILDHEPRLMASPQEIITGA